MFTFNGYKYIDIYIVRVCKPLEMNTRLKKSGGSRVGIQI